MTQATLSNYIMNNDITENVLSRDVASKKTSNMSIPEDFRKIYDDKTATVNQQTDVSTIETVPVEKNNDDNVANFKEYLNSILGDLSIESALDAVVLKNPDGIAEQLTNISDLIEANSDENITDVLQETMPNLLDEVSTEGSVLFVANTGENLDKEVSPLIENLKEDVAKINDIADTSEMFSEEISFDDNFTESQAYFDTEGIESEIKNPAIKTADETISEEADFLADEDALRELNIESIESEMQGSDSGTSLMQEESLSEHAVKVALNTEMTKFDSDLEQAQVQLNSSKATPETNASKIINQVAKQMEGLHNTSKVNIVLNPESLGKVNVQLVKNSEGLSAQLTVDSAETRDILLKGISNLKDSLLSQGFGVDNVSVKLNDTQKSEYQKDWTEQDGQNRGNQEQAKQQKEKEKGLFEKMLAFTQEEDGNV